MGYNKLYTAIIRHNYTWWGDGSISTFCFVFFQKLPHPVPPCGEYNVKRGHPAHCRSRGQGRQKRISGFLFALLSLHLDHHHLDAGGLRTEEHSEKSGCMDIAKSPHFSPPFFSSRSLKYSYMIGWGDFYDWTSKFQCTSGIPRVTKLLPAWAHLQASPMVKNKYWKTIIGLQTVKYFTMHVMHLAHRVQKTKL